MDIKQQIEKFDAENKPFYMVTMKMEFTVCVFPLVS